LSTKKNILISIDWYLPGTASGGPVRSCANFIAHLSQEYNFYIITRDTDYCAKAPYTNVVSNTWNKQANGARVYYVGNTNLTVKKLTTLFKEKTFDSVYINGIYSWYFSILPLLVFKSHPRVIVAPRGMLNPQAFSVKPLKKRLFIFLAKRFGLYTHVTFHATNAIEKAHVLNTIGHSCNVLVAPNMPRAIKQKFVAKNKHNPTRFISLARISKEKGTLKMLQAFKSINIPVVLDLYGPIYDTAYWNLCQQVIKNLPKCVGVTYKGVAKSQEVPKILRGYDFFMMLSEGENFGHAILEAFSAGVPVIISNKTPWTGLQEKNIGWDIDINNSNKVGQVVKKACQISSKGYKQMSKSANSFARDFCTSKNLTDQNKQLFDTF
jgi:glycosyltransferase involved in cell wall biosynthesis